ncbi:hypothetical protein EIK77_006661 [Talaromyces pinophilus]|nr:hypothetical protein EIK77_006661 [Talaromyces pinophilus]
MPLSHLTLTVSHLPTSTSFFLSCLQPLGYKFIGRHDEYIGFGSKADEPADFWLAQEQPGERTPAGAAHIAFPAPSKEAVNTFFISALKAGGTIHGEPKCRDPETGYFSAAVVDFDGNSIEAVYRPDLTTTGSGSRSETGSVARSERTRGPSALQTIKNGSVVSRARSMRTTEDRAVQAAIENIPPSRVKMLAPQQQQQAYAPAQQSSDNSISAKTIIGTLLGATAGAALAYAMIKGDSSSNSSSPPQSSAPAPSQYIQQPPPSQQPQQLLQQQPHQMSMSLPMVMPMLGPAPGYQDQAQQQQPVYRALEAPPTVMAPSQAARSVYTANDAISAYTRSSAVPKSKSPRADTIYEETEYYPPITEGTPRSLYSQEASTINGGSGVRRTSNGSVYATRELPIRAIEYGMSAVSSQQTSQQSQSQKVRSKSYPCDPSTFISSYAETRQQQQQGHIIGEAESDFSSISTIKPVAAAKSVASSHRSSATKSSSKHSSSHRHEEDLLHDARSTSSSNRTAHKVALPDSRPGSTYTSATKASKRSSASTIKEIRRDRERDRDSLVDAYDIPLPASAAPSTVFLDAVVDITPEDSISQVGISNHSHNHNHTDSKSSSGRSHRSRSGPSSQSQAASTASKRDKDVGESGSKFDQPIKPSDSISQVSSNHHRHSSSSHHSHHSHGSGGYRGSSRVSGERSTSGKKSHSGGSVRSGHY